MLKEIFKWLFIAFAGIAVFAVVIIASVDEVEPPKGKDYPKYNDNATKMNAIIFAEQRIESLLKAPSTADFSGGRSRVTRDFDTLYVEGYVDAQNGFGAMIRSHYKVRVEFIGENVRTEVIEFE